ncbi:MAG: hypothetical protein QOH13_2773 [Thermoleophilaceae bacterium]|jgi:hypothetical protein|nr:hypothetical protein [Thermoleophilaceae bacterium]
MESKSVARAGAACGIIFPVALSLGRDGVLMLSAFGLVAFVPFLAYLYSLLRSADRQGEWLAAAALGAGLMGITLKLVSVTPEIAYRNVPTGSQAHAALVGIADAATVASLYPFAVLCGIIALQTARFGVLPRWLGAFAGITAVALAINGSVEHAASVPALLLFVAWSFLAGATLFVRATWRQPVTTGDAVVAR